MKLIALTAPKGAGKDTAGATLAELGYTRTAFADPIKRAIESMFELPSTVWEDRYLKENSLSETGLVPGFNFSPRFLAETLGTEWGRETIHSNIWIKATEAKIMNLMDTSVVPKTDYSSRFVVTDLRFDNEAIWVKSMGGVVIEIVRPEHDWDPYHPSNAGPAEELVDYKVNNYGTIQDLEDAIHTQEQEIKWHN